MLRGFDISAHQSPSVVKSLTADFVFIKATEGKDLKYPTSFNAQRADAKKKGMIIGSYHFARPEESSGASQADRFLAVAKPEPRDLLILDLEASELNQANTNKFAKDWSNRVKAKYPNNTRVIYMGSGYATNGTGKGLSEYFDYWWYPQYPSTSLTKTWKTSFSPWLPKGLTCGWSKPHIWQWTNNFGGIDASITTLTKDALQKRSGAAPAAPAPKPAAPKPVGVTAAQVLQIAASQIGTGESPAGSNHNKYTVWYGIGNGSWCYMFLSWVFNQAGALDLVHGKHAYVPDCKGVFSPHGEWHTSGPKPGDLVCFDFNKTNSPEHIGIVEKVLSSTTLQTIEGNTTGSHGDGVYRKTRRRSDVYGYARPAYGTIAEDDDFMAQYVSIDKNTTGDKPSRVETLVADQWQQVYFNKNNSADAANHHAVGDYPSFVTGPAYYNGAVNLRLTGLPKGAEGQIRVLYIDAKSNAPKAHCSISEFLGSTGDTFVNHACVGYVPAGQKARIEVAVYDIAEAKPTVIQGQVRLNVKEA